MKWRTVALISLGVGSAAEAIWHMLIGEIGIPLGCCVLLATCVAMLMLRFPLRAAMATVAMWIVLCLVAGVTPVGLTALMLVSLAVMAFRRAVVAGICAMLAMVAWLMMCEGIAPLIHDADMPFMQRLHRRRNGPQYKGPLKRMMSMAIPEAAVMRMSKS